MQTTTKRYHHIASETMNPFDLVRESYQQAIATWLCKGCKLPKPGVQQVDVVLENARVNRVPLNFVGGCGIPVARRDFLYSLGDDLIKKDLYLGRVYDPEGKEVSGLVTFRGKYCVIVRGRKHVTHRICSECGRTLYFSMIGGRYLFPEPPNAATIYESGELGLILPDDVFQRIDLTQWLKVTHEVLHVPESPPDRILDLPSIEDRRLTVPSPES